MIFKRRPEAGFTLVELMLAMAFISILLVMIALLVLQVSAIYNKGLSLKAVNESGQLISSELQRQLNVAPQGSVKYIQRLADDTRQEGGRLCVNGTVYAWNDGAYITNPHQPNPLNIFSDDRGTDVRFIKFAGSADEFCPAPDAEDGPASLPNTGISELLVSGDTNLAIRGFKFCQTAGDENTRCENAPNGPADDGRQTIYQISFLLGTNDIELLDPATGRCLPPSGAQQEFCAVNEFSFTARVGNAGEDE